MKFLGPTNQPRLNEAVAVVFLLAGLFVFASLASYQPLDPSFDTVSSPAHVANLTGRVGAALSDLLLEAFGLGA
jgi:DNA segregation ATPase FtsK/SpoIIIE, S-DNA-T family